MKHTLCALSALLAASNASAQQGAPYPPPAYGPPPYYAPAPVPVVPIWISSDVQGPTYELRRPGDGNAVFFCRSAACAAYLPIGEYDVYVPPTADYAEGKRRVKIEKPSQLVIQPRDASARTAGLAMGIAGTVLVVAGFTTLAVAADRHCEDTSCSEQQDTTVLLSLGGIIAGAILSPIGWVSFGKSFKPGVQVIEKQ